MCVIASDKQVLVRFLTDDAPDIARDANMEHNSFFLYMFAKEKCTTKIIENVKHLSQLCLQIYYLITTCRTGELDSLSNAVIKLREIVMSTKETPVKSLLVMHWKLKAKCHYIERERHKLLSEVVEPLLDRVSRDVFEHILVQYVS